MTDPLDNETLFLKEAHLSGFKSIENVKVTFIKGLNIIIGKNAVGKTNFLKFLEKSLSLNYDELNNFSSKLIFQSNKEISIDSSRKIDVKEILTQPDLDSFTLSKLYIENKLVKDKKDKETSIREKLKSKEIRFSSTFLCHGIPNEYLIVEKPLSFKIRKGQLSNDLSKIFRAINTPYFIKGLVIDLSLDLFEIDLTERGIRKLINEIFSKSLDPLKNQLREYSPIEDIKLSENFNVFVEEDPVNVTINNLFLEFKLNGNWLPFSNLSDGTRRIFYILSEVFEDNTEEDKTIRLRPTTAGMYNLQRLISRIILIEEPELGIHPHQFHKLLIFLKEASRDKQIIITTHSPQALDSIDNEELNRIIIAYNTKEKGTQFRHLNDNELLKAHKYIQDDFLSDYWLYSDLES